MADESQKSQLGNCGIANIANKIIFDPCQSVTFMPSEDKQMCDVLITNNSTTNVAFKMKSTRPGVFKMRPVYATVKPKEKKKVKLIFKGFKKGGKNGPSRKDHFTIVYTIAKGKDSDPNKIWRDHKSKKKIATEGVLKKLIKVQYVGFNDKDNEKPDAPANTVPLTVNPDKTTNTMSRTGAPSTMNGYGNEDDHPVVYLVFNKREEEEVDEEENDKDDDDEDEKEEKKKE